MLFDWTVRKKIERDTYMAEKKQLTVAQKKQRKRKIQNGLFCQMMKKQVVRA